MSESRAGGSTSFKILGVLWALMLLGGMVYWVKSSQGVGGPAFAMLTRFALAVFAFRIASGINSGSIERPRPLAVGYTIAVLVIVWLGIAGSASPNSSVGFLSIQSMYSREPGAFVPEFRQRPNGLPYGDVMIFPLVLIFLVSLVTVIRTSASSSSKA